MASITVLILSVIDILVGFLIYFKFFPFFSGIMFYLAVFVLIKGVWSVLTSFSYIVFDVLGWIDVVSGVVLLLISHGIVFGFFNWVALIMVLKGFYCFFTSLA